MKDTNTGGPAFPTLPEHGANSGCLGMTLRDYFAAKAIQGLLANPKLEKQILTAGQSWIEASAWAVADAMMKVRDE
jgi:hypothetical protein